MESDAFRRSFLRFVASERGLDWTPGEESFAAAREARLERLGNLISEYVDRDALLRLIVDGPPGARLQQGYPDDPARKAPSNGNVVASASPALADGPDLRADA
jgi:adenosylcobyric acid synthase